MPAEAELEEEAETRIRRSEDGEWVIRLNKTPTIRAAVVREVVIREYERLADLGMYVLAFESVPSISEKRLFTITPWVPDLVVCSEDRYNQTVKPVVDVYHAQTAGLRKQGVLSVHELGHHKQYFDPADLPKPVNHDVDPMVIGITAQF